MSTKTMPYRVLARKYRPQNFDELIGQDALVRTLRNAIETGRIAHAFMLTGVRGVGKTTTARIIAKALNYTGPDGKAGPTTGPTDDCALCRAIAEDRHPDVIEMDAASRTGVDDIREILDGVRYAPTEARYKVYIIDEVHMLSKQAFNALLKTLEEPPEHVKFIFATTEIRKVPVTVLSRCQRFDLRRVDVPTLSAHYKSICAKENVGIEDEALAQIARAADGSVRDGLSLLDQAIALSGESITAAQVQDMLGLGDRARNIDLLERALRGDIKEALEILDEIYNKGGDPLVLMQDLLDLTHMLTRLRAVPDAPGIRQSMGADQIERLGALAAQLSMPTLGKTWQLVLKGIGEVMNAPNPQSAAEMIIMRLSYAADLPDPKDLIKKLGEQPETAPQGGPPSSSGGGGSRATAGVSASYSGQAALAAAPESQPLETRALRNLEDIVALLDAGNEPLLAGRVYQYVRLVKLAEGRLEIALAENAPVKLPQDLGAQLSRLSGKRWLVSLSGGAAQPSLAQQEEARSQAEVNEVLALAEVKKIFEIFPDAKLTGIIPPPTETKE